MPARLAWRQAVGAAAWAAHRAPDWAAMGRISGAGMRLQARPRPDNGFRIAHTLTHASRTDRIAMKRSTDRILTTHVGSLIRPPSCPELLRAKQKGEGYDAGGACAEPEGRRSPRSCASRPRSGVDVVSDGEFGKAHLLVAIRARAPRRASSAGRSAPSDNPFARGADRTRFAEFYEELDARDDVADHDRLGRGRRRSSTPARRCCSRTSTTSRRR